ncbi:alpha/beta fold hydrolase [Nocardia uniformis]|uniref:alpha/beta fold hydrolase n=1 Tax=Nocardia uniformis TaxID=53432 RepID=UPI0008373F4C|nr:alpha/beta fold hydrolase [Nocardia uniformis]
MVANVARLPRAVRNLWSVSFGDGIEPPRPAPDSTVYRRPHAHLRRYDRSTPGSGNPVLFVPPLAVTPTCFDLRPGQSLVRYLIEHGKQPYVIDYGEFTSADRGLGLEDWTHDIVPTAIRKVADEHGRPVDVIGWSLGGVLAMMSGAAQADLPIASIAALAPPLDQRHTPFLGPIRLAGRLTGGREIAWATKLMGGIPQEFVRLGFRLQAIDRELSRPLFLARNAHDTEALARMAAVDRFTASMPGYPGRSYWQIYRSLIMRNELASGAIRLRSDLTIELAKLTCRVLLIGSRTDPLVPAAGVRSGIDILSGASEVQFVEVTGGHLGLVVGPDAPTTTWPAVLEFLDR